MKREKRALLLLGAGASLEFGGPSTMELTRILGRKVLEDEWMQHSGGARAFEEIRSTLEGYFAGGTQSVNFEQIYHCAHELLYTFPPTSGAVNEYRPVLLPFLDQRFDADERALRTLIGRMVEFLYAEISQACEMPRTNLATCALHRRAARDLRHAGLHNKL